MASKPPAAAAAAAANTTPRKPGTPSEKTKPADAKGKGATDKKGKDAGDKAGEGEQAAPEPTSGSGKFHYQNGATYEGDWILEALPANESAAPAAPAVEKANGRRFRHGRGTFVDGTYSYTGEWDHDQMHGKGMFAYASGAIYDGEWVRNRYQGKGAFRWKDGRSYTGDWVENKMHGSGTYVGKDGHSWTGQFFNGSGPGLTCHV
ncbi:1-phosphatidylinositol-4-phosphate 5-kinase [Klebsormidium nitens]|uniref:1-phosphatidylinositol-4-phosphate 5-kinase n=1 Tax=Klebsormidium nitens TaxID=105231 RepID=A0A0U9I6F7_KLENI|nr:1-phosphatidylinositol-4-phosphate 5-kinase [Klebsormidium nitens]|eukprot:GAQ79425.1 1-phosphatidylinositol-4-phosphate 5-kinase [Klebsormidium nitens]